MGWLRRFLAGGVDEESDLAACERDIVRLCEHVRLQPRIDGRQDTQTEILVAETGELKLYLAAVIRLLVAKGLVTRDEFARLVDVIDRSDGREDGQFGGDIAQRRTWTGEGAPPGAWRAAVRLYPAR